MDYHPNHVFPLVYLQYWLPIDTGLSALMVPHYGTSTNNFHTVEYAPMQSYEAFTESPVQRVIDTALDPPGKGQSHTGASRKPTKPKKNKFRLNPKESAARQVRNTESNICNQALAFILSTNKSGSTLRRLLAMSVKDNTQDAYYLYYEYASALNKYKRKYLSRKFLLGLFVGSACENFTEITQSR